VFIPFLFHLYLYIYIFRPLQGRDGTPLWRGVIEVREMGLNDVTRRSGPGIVLLCIYFLFTNMFLYVIAIKSLRVVKR
jgi:hypothetical protein